MHLCNVNLFSLSNQVSEVILQFSSVSNKKNDGGKRVPKIKACEVVSLQIGGSFNYVLALCGCVCVLSVYKDDEKP